MNKGVLVIEVPIQSAMGDERLGPKLVELLRSGEGDIVFFGVTRLLSRTKKRQDAIDSGPIAVSWKPQP